ncbi:hypothetical protein D9619_008939 [Psilocybe cf. subviscida]|uniref:RRM domain-containing protein n=1 Tax=Psilocybe cf. subviscida TaxID=2480587 RepID=A0A8H5BU94_9AGAR|nr:hypothetical protein D9619_008939 [Psilocybe cf. subviscida]
MTHRENTNAQRSEPPRSYAFVEFKSTRDAEDAYYDMHGRHFEGSRLSIQWAKNPPSSVWRYDRRTPPPSHRPSRDRERSRSPRRRDDRDRDNGYRDREERRRRSRSPEPRRRTPSPDRRRDDRDRGRPLSPTPVEEVSKDGERDNGKERAQSPPYNH